MRERGGSESSELGVTNRVLCKLAAHAQLEAGRHGGGVLLCGGYEEAVSDGCLRVRLMGLVVGSRREA